MLVCGRDKVCLLQQLTRKEVLVEHRSLEWLLEENLQRTDNSVKWPALRVRVSHVLEPNISLRTNKQQVSQDTQCT